MIFCFFHDFCFRHGMILTLQRGASCCSHCDYFFFFFYTANPGHLQRYGWQVDKNRALPNPHEGSMEVFQKNVSANTSKDWFASRKSVVALCFFDLSRASNWKRKRNSPRRKKLFLPDSNIEEKSVCRVSVRGKEPQPLNRCPRVLPPACPMTVPVSCTTDGTCRADALSHSSLQWQ